MAAAAAGPRAVDARGDAGGRPGSGLAGSLAPFGERSLAADTGVRDREALLSQLETPPVDSLLTGWQAAWGEKHRFR